jgi:NAD(P)-dependent dehydrogenase (short-subunit alcohol dehydrogenase family)
MEKIVTEASTEPLRFDGRVAIVTGAGGQKPSLGESYARYLAARGAKVVVNDLGIGPDGSGALPANAQTIVDEINDAGGAAIGDTHSVAAPDSAKAIVQTALDAWGRVDILINNAGVVFFTLFDEISDGDLRRIVDTHLYGNIWMARAAWPHMKKAGYGRIVNICSESIHGSAYLATYCAAKAGIVGLTQGLALEGARSGIKVNALAPRATTRKHSHMMGLEPGARSPQIGSVDKVAPVVAYLGHERCALNGKVLWASDGKAVEYRYYQSVGYSNPQLTIEDIDAHVDQVIDQRNAQPIEAHDPAMLDRVPRRPYVPRS